MPTYIIGFVVFVGIIVLLVWLRYQRRQSLKRDVMQRVGQLKHMAETRKFHELDDTDLDPNIEYMNVTKAGDTQRGDLVIFTADGIVEKRLGLSEEEIQKFAQVGGWSRTADSYRTVEGTFTMVNQFERARKQT